MFSISKSVYINLIQVRGAARKGIRLRRQKEAQLRNKKKRLQESLVPKQKRNYGHGLKVDQVHSRFFNERKLDANLPKPPADNVYFTEKFRKPRYSFDECIEHHRQMAHPDILNIPDNLIQATIELNLKMKIKKKKYIDNIESTLCYPHIFNYQVRPRKIVALSKDEQAQMAAKEAGAIISGGMDIVNLLKTKQLTHRDFDHIVCHNNIILDFAAVKGMKGSTFFPTKQRGNFGDDLVKLVIFFKNGLDYSLKVNPEDNSNGIITSYFGKLSMTNEQLRENIVSLFDSVTRFKPLNLDDDKQFFERVMITMPESKEILRMNFWEVYPQYQDPENMIDEDEEESSIESKKSQQ